MSRCINTKIFTDVIARIVMYFYVIVPLKKAFPGLKTALGTTRARKRRGFEG